jgi:hypothetical protein
MNLRAQRLLGAALLAAAFPTAAFSSGFPIAATAAQNDSTLSVAFDGTNFLVGLQGGGIRAQLVSPAGDLLASVSVPRSGDPPVVAFDGTNYLLVWGEPTNPSGPVVYAQLVSTAGSLVGSAFLVSQSTIVNEVDGVAFDGTNYLVVWTNDRPLASEHDVYGRFVSTAGAPMGNDFKINDGAGREGNIAFGAGSYFVVWQEDIAQTEMRGRFVTPAGVLQSAFTVNGSTESSANPSAVAFDGTNFLSVFTDNVGGLQQFDFLGQLVSPAGALVGSPIPITSAPGTQLLPYIAFDGVNYLITWTDLANDANSNFACDPLEGTCLDIHGQYLSPSGTLVGTNFPIVTDAGSQGQSPVAWGAGKYLVAFIDGVATSNSDVYGIFLPSEMIFRDGFEAD